MCDNLSQKCHMNIYKVCKCKAEEEEKAKKSWISIISRSWYVRFTRVLKCVDHTSHISIQYIFVCEANAKWIFLLLLTIYHNSSTIFFHIFLCHSFLLLHVLTIDRRLHITYTLSKYFSLDTRKRTHSTSKNLTF